MRYVANGMQYMIRGILLDQVTGSCKYRCIRLRTPGGPVYGKWYMVHGKWYIVSGMQYMVDVTWSWHVRERWKER